MKSFITVTAILILFAPIAGINSDQNEDTFERQAREIKEEYYQNLENFKETNLSAQFKIFLEENKFICTGGRDPSSMSLKSYLQSFAQGPCSPTAIIPGASASKLVVKIDCEKLRKSNPEIFADCGWTSCSGSSAPKKEYRIWIPKVDSPFSPFVPEEKRRRCFIGLAGFDVKTEDGNTKAFDREGVESFVLGETEATRRSSSCGLEASMNLLPFKLQVKEMKYLKFWKTLWESAGYINGLTYQTLPYDWRKAFQENRLNYKFKQVIDGLYEITGKKVTIVAHSFGNYQALNNLWKLPQEEKDKKIARYMSVAPPLLGSARAVQQLLGMDSKFLFNLVFFEIGMTPEMSKGTLGNYPAAFNLMPSDFIFTNKNEDWLKSVYKRIDLEKQRKDIDKDGSVMDIFPSWKETCKKGFKKDLREEGCFTGLYKMEKLGKVMNDEFNALNIGDILDKYSFNKNSLGFWKTLKESNFRTMPNPGVQMNVFYSNLLPTTVQIEYDNDPKAKINAGEYYNPERVVEELGDGTIDTTSSITPMIKWADEYNNKKAGAKPMNFIEVCSHFKPRTSIFDSEINGEKIVKNSSYFGVDCNCEGSSIFPSKGKDCDHTGLMVDDKVLQFIFNSGVDGVKSVGVGKRFLDMSESGLRDYIDNCDLWF